MVTTRDCISHKKCHNSVIVDCKCLEVDNNWCLINLSHIGNHLRIGVTFLSYINWYCIFSTHCFHSSKHTLQQFRFAK